MSSHLPCPCGSGQLYSACCEPYITLTTAAPTPEALMRARYTAYAVANMDYLEHTTQGKAKTTFNRDKSLKFAKESTWQGLEIIRAYQPFATTGYVEFIAHYNDAHDHHQHLHELSEFKLENGQWFYVDGKQETHHTHHHHRGAVPIQRSTPKIGRNDPCSCGSGKKYKKCCG